MKKIVLLILIVLYAEKLFSYECRASKDANLYGNACYLENGICRFPTWAYPKKMKNPFDYDSSWKGNKKKEGR